MPYGPPPPLPEHLAAFTIEWIDQSRLFQYGNGHRAYVDAPDAILKDAWGNIYKRANSGGWELASLGREITVQERGAMLEHIPDVLLQRALPGRYPFPTQFEREISRHTNQNLLRQAQERRAAEFLEDIDAQAITIDAINTYQTWYEQMVQERRYAERRARGGDRYNYDQPVRPGRLDDSRPERMTEKREIVVPLVAEMGHRVADGERPLPTFSDENLAERLRSVASGCRTQGVFDASLESIRREIAAYQNARDYLKSIVPASVLKTYWESKEHYGEMAVESPMVPGYTYMVQSNGGMTPVFYKGQPQFLLCVHPDSQMPYEDSMAIHYLSIMHREEEWVAIGNAQPWGSHHIGGSQAEHAKDILQKRLEIVRRIRELRARGVWSAEKVAEQLPRFIENVRIGG